MGGGVLKKIQSVQSSNAFCSLSCTIANTKSKNSTYNRKQDKNDRKSKETSENKINGDIRHGYF